MAKRDEDLRRLLTTALETGEPLELGADRPEVPSQGQSRDDLQIRADLIRDVLTRRQPTERRDPAGLSIHGAIVVGHLDLSSVDLEVPLAFVSCGFTEPLNLARLNARSILLADCEVWGADEAGVSIFGLGAHVRGDVTIQDSLVRGSIKCDNLRCDGAFNIVNSSIASETALALASTMDGSRALQLQGASFKSRLFMQGSEFHGTLDLHRMRVESTVSLQNCDVLAGLGRQSINADGLYCANSVFFDESRIAGTVRLNGAVIEGQLSFVNTTITTDLANSIIGDGLRNRGGLVLRHLRAQGTVRFMGAFVESRFDLFDATIAKSRDSSTSVTCQSAHIDRELLIEQCTLAQGIILDEAIVRGSTVISDTSLTQLSIPNAEFGGIFSLVATTLLDPGVSLNGEQANFKAIKIERLTSAGHVNLSGSATAGTFRLQGPDLAGEGSFSLERAAVGRLVLNFPPDKRPTLNGAAGWTVSSIAGVLNHSEVFEWVSNVHNPAQPLHELANAYERDGDYAAARRLHYSAADIRFRSGRWTTRAAGVLTRLITGHGYYPLRTIIWIAILFSSTMCATAVVDSTFTTATTAAIRSDVACRLDTAGNIQSRNRNCNAPVPRATQNRVPPRVSSELCRRETWDTPCFDSVQYSLGVALPLAAPLFATSQAAWSSSVPWFSVTIALARIAGWLLSALFIAGVTGLLRKS